MLLCRPFLFDLPRAALPSEYPHDRPSSLMTSSKSGSRKATRSGVSRALVGENCPVVVVRREGLLGVVSSCEVVFVGAEKGERCSVIRGDGERDLGAFLEYSWPWRPAPGCRRFIALFWGVVCLCFLGFLVWVWVAPSCGVVLFCFRVCGGLVRPFLAGLSFEAMQGKVGREGGRCVRGETLKLILSRSFREPSNGNWVVYNRKACVRRRPVGSQSEGYSSLYIAMYM